MHEHGLLATKWLMCSANDKLLSINTLRSVTQLTLATVLEPNAKI